MYLQPLSQNFENIKYLHTLGTKIFNFEILKKTQKIDILVEGSVCHVLDVLQ